MISSTQYIKIYTKIYELILVINQLNAQILFL